MTAQADLRDLESRPQRYWNVDGIPEIIMGLTWMVWGGALILGRQIDHESAYKAYWLVVPPLLAVSGFAGQWLTKKLKERYTYPRTGYVVYKEPSPKLRYLTAGVAVVVAAALAALIVTGRSEGVRMTITPGVGVVISLALLVASMRQKAAHLLALAGVSLALAAAAAALRWNADGMSGLFVGLGLASALVGAWRFRQYLAANRPAEDARQ